MEFSEFVAKETAGMTDAQRAEWLKRVAAQSAETSEREEFRLRHTGESARIDAQISRAFGNGDAEVVEYQTKEEMISDRISRVFGAGR